MPNPLTALVRLMRPRADERDVKQSRVAQTIAFHTLGRPVWTPRDYAALADEGFQRNAVAYRCVRAIAEAAASVPWLLYDGPRELAEHPLLALLERGRTARMAGPDFLETLVGQFCSWRAMPMSRRWRPAGAVRTGRRRCICFGPTG